MLIVKIMSAEDTADSDTRKSFALHAGVASAIFERRGDGENLDPTTFTRPWLTLIFADKAMESEAFEPKGNVYVMNERGQTVASYGVAPIIYAVGTAEAPTRLQATDEWVTKAVDRFLAWQLPRNFAPDGGIAFDAARLHPSSWPTGTNLLDATQAKAMLQHVLGLTAD